MNDPNVVALIYTVEHGTSINYKDVSPLHYDESPEFDLTVEDKIARFEFKKHYVHADTARQAIEPFIQHWEFDAALRDGPHSFSLRYEKAEIVDRNPSPPARESGTYKLRVESRLSVPESRARTTYCPPHYPPPPVYSAVNPVDPDVRSMYDRYVNYRLGKEPLLGMVYFCLTVLEYNFRGQKSGTRSLACQHYRIAADVLNAIGNLTAKKGDLSIARKRNACVDALKTQEEKFLKKAAQKMVYRAAQVAADENQPLPQITMADLPSL